MPKKVKTGKARLDKWYRIAKEQGYRSRAAFKLIQLNRKYNFLNSANVLVDLCAAPGGWLQVATRYMPVNSIKIGIDLVSIKHVPGCITFQEDITTPKCLALIKKEIRNEKVDVVLNDGAPNVGANWSKDAFSQVELVLAALKLAATVLKKGGTFVTKVFRSADYNSLIWVLNKFFEKVEATKPAASRTQSAEIFIVCLRFIAPDYTDPKLFDMRYVFQDTEGDLVKESNDAKIDSIDKLLKKLKSKNREGYDKDTPITMYRVLAFEDFLNTENVYDVLFKYNKMSFTEKDKEKYLELVKPPEDYEETIADFKQFDKRGVQSLLKWRSKLLRVLGRNNKEEKVNKMDEEKEGEEHDTDSELEAEIEKGKRREVIEQKREKEKLLKKMAKLKGITPQEVEANDEIDFDWNRNQKKVERLGFVDVDDDDFEIGVTEKRKARNERDVEDNIELLYELKKKKIKKEEDKAARRQEERKSRKFDPLQEENFQLDTIENGKEAPVEEERRVERRRDDFDDEDDDDDDDDYSDMENNNLEDLEAINQSTVEMAQNLLTNSKWFDRDIFKQGIDTGATNGLINLKNPIKLEKAKAQKTQNTAEAAAKPAEKKKEADDGYESDEQIKIKTKKEKLKVTPAMKAAEKRKAKIKQDDLSDFLKEDKGRDEDSNKIEVVPQLRYEDYDIDDLAQMRVLANKMLRKKDREEIMEDSYNRYSRPVDEDAPDWFLEDEKKHNFKIMPITKEEFKAEKEKLMAIKNRPIKKIVEAKIRRKMQVQKKLKRAQNKAKDIMEQEGVTEVSKLKQVQGLYKKALAAKKQEKKYIVSRNFNAGSKGGKGGNRKVGRNTRLVDSRLKKDKRAQKRLEKSKKGSGSGSSGQKGPRKSKTRMVKRRKR